MPRSTSTASWTARGRPMSPSASSAARTVRPEYRTSSTRTTILPSMPAGGTSVWPSARAGRSLRSSRYMVMSRDPAGTGAALDLLQALGQTVRERDSPGRDAEQDDVVGAAGPLEDLVRDPGQRPPDVGGLQDRPGLCETGTAGTPVASGLVSRMHLRDLLSRLTGRALKDVGPHHRTSPAPGRPADTSVHRVTVRHLYRLCPHLRHISRAETGILCHRGRQNPNVAGLPATSLGRVIAAARMRRPA